MKTLFRLLVLSIFIFLVGCIPYPPMGGYQQGGYYPQGFGYSGPTAKDRYFQQQGPAAQQRHECTQHGGPACGGW
jgi:hypothetical protein